MTEAKKFKARKPGAGRPKTSRKTGPNQVTVYLLPDQQVKLDRAAKQAGQTRSEFIRHAVDDRL